MSSNKVSAKIISDARARVSEIEADYIKRKAKLSKESKEHEALYRKETAKLAAEEAERIQREILSEARLGARRQVLAVRHELIKQAIDEASSKFTKSRQYAAILERIVKEQGKGAQVLLSSSDKKRFRTSSWAKGAKEAFIKGGVILRRKGFDLNFSLDAAFEIMGEGLMLELAEILFGKLKPSSNS
ncbi:hypothetical protein JXM67_00760 [candidate division WOR-3 bacterium]|nr:hypothetical protein [candidate division WOR-3 bacterium]